MLEHLRQTGCSFLSFNSNKLHVCSGQDTQGTGQTAFTGTVMPANSSVCWQAAHIGAAMPVQTAAHGQSAHTHTCGVQLNSVQAFTVMIRRGCTLSGSISAVHWHGAGFMTCNRILCGCPCRR